MLRVFNLGGWPKAGGEIVLAAAESRHLVKVRRARAGAPVTVLDGRGGVGNGTLVSADPDSAHVRIKNFTHEPPPPPRVLAVGLPKGDVFIEIIRQAAELGATAVQPLFTERTEVKLDAEGAARKVERWRDAAIEACKQSGNPWLPEILAPVALPKWLAGLPAIAEAKQDRFVAALTSDAVPVSQFETRNLELETQETKRETRNAKLETVIAVGPEGDFSPAEYTQLRAAGFIAVRLPGHILRVETACATALALLNAYI